MWWSQNHRVKDAPSPQPPHTMVVCVCMLAPNEALPGSGMHRGLMHASLSLLQAVGPPRRAT